MTVELEIARPMSANRLAGGAIQVRETGEPRWRAAVTYAAMARAEYQALRAWLDTARGGLRRFLVHDALQPYPLLYPKPALLAMTRAGGSLAFDGSATVTSLAANAITLATLPALFGLKTGDYIGLIEAGRYGLHRLVEDAVATSGGVLVANVEPRVATTLFTTAAVATVVRASCLMVLDASSVQASRSAAARAPISFSAVQALA